MHFVHYHHIYRWPILIHLSKIIGGYQHNIQVLIVQPDCLQPFVVIAVVSVAAFVGVVIALVGVVSVVAVRMIICIGALCCLPFVTYLLSGIIPNDSLNSSRDISSPETSSFAIFSTELQALELSLSLLTPRIASNFSQTFVVLLVAIVSFSLILSATYSNPSLILLFKSSKVSNTLSSKFLC